MHTLNNFISGADRASKSWKWIMILWFSSLLLAWLVLLPAKSSFYAVIGPSMITEKLKNGIDIEALFDPGTHLSAIIPSLGTGFLLVVFSGFILNIFFNGGLFSCLRNSMNKCTSLHFFGRAAASFWPFLVITIIMFLIMAVLALIIIGIPLIIAFGSDLEGILYKTFIISSVLFLIVLPVLLLVADYARAWQAASSGSTCLKAIGMGFRLTFRNLASSYFIMACIMIVQILFTWLVFSVIAYMNPLSGSGLVLLFLLSQFSFIIRLFLRVWRYGSVTAMYEFHINQLNT